MHISYYIIPGNEGLCVCSVCVSEVKVIVYVCISMQIFVRAFLLGVRLGMKTNVVLGVVRYDEKMYSIRVWGMHTPVPLRIGRESGVGRQMGYIVRCTYKYYY